MFETETDDDLTIPAQDEAIIVSYGAFIAEQLRHQYRLGIIRGMKLAEQRVRDEKVKYGR